MILKMIVAYDLNQGIGKNNKLPWYIREDLKYFSTLTKGDGKNAIIMGKNTWNSIPKKPLPKRDNLILSTTLEIEESNPKQTYVKSFSDINKILQFCENEKYDEVWIIGGSKIYEQLITHKLLKYIYVTHIQETYDCDTFFPKMNNWTLIKSNSIFTKERTIIRKQIYERSNFII